jgi:hypothetical protein
MQKEKKTAQELADMIQAEINVAGTFVQVHTDKAYGWHPTVFAAPENAHTFQMEGERIAARLRTKYDLKEENVCKRHKVKQQKKRHHTVSYLKPVNGFMRASLWLPRALVDAPGAEPALFARIHTLGLTRDPLIPVRFGRARKLAGAVASASVCLGLCFTRPALPLLSGSRCDGGQSGNRGRRNS